MAVRIAFLHALFFAIASVANCDNYPFQSLVPRKTFLVNKYGAVPDGRTDNSQAFLRAWKDACKYEGRSVVLIPEGKYLVETVSFEGPCKFPIALVIRGTLKAPTDPGKFSTNTWIAFRYINRLTVAGGGFLDGTGSAAWKYNDCQSNPNCMALPASMRFDFVVNSKIHHLKSFNSKNTHINLFACTNMSISNVRISAPGESPNTDGIHIGSSSNIRISKSIISTGDDCVAMVSGSHNIDISDVACGPGHGISIGSLGKGHDERVSNIRVRNCTFLGTDNGVRIKTWGAASDGSSASYIVFEDIVMKNVRNPIVIDQQYCPIPNCLSGNSGVQIQDVMFKNIWGVSNTKVALNIECSEIRPCKDIKLIDIRLAFNGRGPSTAVCSNVQGSSNGRVIPRGCHL
ncbi:hypothetical protein ACS0TY_018801 [Phlomoides rotata]